MPEDKKEGRREETKLKPAKASSFEILFHKKPAALLTLLLQDKLWYPSALARESGQSYVYATKIVNQFEKDGLIVCTPKGKRRIVKLTEKGDKIARTINEISTILSSQTNQKIEK